MSEKMLKVAIVGSRNFTDYETLERFILARIDVAQIARVISGGANGADTLAVAFAHKHNLWIQELRPDWAKYHRGAGPRRNQQIVDLAEVMFAFPMGESPGTRDSIRKARAKGIPVHVLEVPSQG